MITQGKVHLHPGSMGARNNRKKSCLVEIVTVTGVIWKVRVLFDYYIFVFYPSNSGPILGLFLYIMRLDI